jgi:hypothetical protein
MCFVEEVFSKQNPPGLRHGNGGDPEVLQEESSQLAFANAKTFG